MGVTRSKSKLVLIRSLLITSAFGVGAYAAHTDGAHTNAAQETAKKDSLSRPSSKQVLPKANQTKTPEAASSLDQDAVSLHQPSQHAPSLKDVVDSCQIRESGKIEGIALQYLECTEKHASDEGRAYEVTDNFTVPPLLARRFHFWRRVYSLWTKDHYILHVAAWPEVVLEVYEKAPESEVPSKAPGVSSPAVEGNQPLKKFSESRREEYAQLLKRMHENSSTPQRFTPAMQRIAKSMEHISEPNKFLTASESLRIQRGQKDFIAQGLRTAPKYLPAIEKEFAGQKVPVELSKLAFIESSFNLKALSKVGASGVYQIMPETGKQYLRIQDGIDERNDPIKAGRAAARILRFYYDSIGSWPLAITAYNHGVGGIRRAMGSVGSDRLEDLIVRYEGSGFGFASKNFYTGFLAILATLAQKDQHFPGIKSPAPLRFKVVQLPTPIAIDDLQKLYRMSAAEILRLNPDISPQLVRNHGSLPKNFHLKISGVPGAQLATANSGSESQKK